MKYVLSLFCFFFLMSCATSNPSKYSKIEYEAGACFGFCPTFKITINPDKTAVIDAVRFTFKEGRSKDDFSEEKEGIFKTTIKKEDYSVLIEKLDALEINSLKNYYGNRKVSDLPTSFLKINFKDGSQKQIQDYGKKGTEKLHDLYDFIEELRKTQTWTKVE